MLGEADRARVAAAVTAAEAASDGEIVTIIAPASDGYNDVTLHGALIVALLAMALAAAVPAPVVTAIAALTRGWGVPTAGEFAAALILIAILGFLIGRALFALAPLKAALTPAATRTRRVRRRAVLLFRIAAENRTRAKTGVLLYLSLAERRAELVADAAINARVTPDTWGRAMHLLIDGVRDGRPADGMIAAVEAVGVVLAEHFPRSPDDTNELPDRLIVL